MAGRVYGYQGYKDYQYETTPRKIEPEYEPEDDKTKLKKKSKALGSWYLEISKSLADLQQII